MTCLKPITAWQKKFADLKQSPNDYYNDKRIKFKKPPERIINNYQEIKIACGHCLGCRLDHANQWATRIMLESEKHTENCFITLTYKPEKLPLTNDSKMTLRKKDLQDFVKRLRYHLGDKKILYFGCGEYGTTTYRPHYHIIIFGWKPKDLEQIQNSKSNNPMFKSKMIEEIWENGMVAVQELNYKTACYTARYVQKKAGIKPQKRILDKNYMEPEVKIDERTKKPFIRMKGKYITEKNDIFGREKEFLVMSKKPAIGLEYWLKNKEIIKKNAGILIKIDDSVKQKQIPRYFKKKWENEDAINLAYEKYNQEKLMKKNIENNLKNIQDKNPQEKWLEYIKTSLENKAKYLKRDEI